jgi:hypothetical protein
MKDTRATCRCTRQVLRAKPAVSNAGWVLGCGRMDVRATSTAAGCSMIAVSDAAQNAGRTATGAQVRSDTDHQRRIDASSHPDGHALRSDHAAAKARKAFCESRGYRGPYPRLHQGGWAMPLPS